DGAEEGAEGEGEEEDDGGLADALRDIDGDLGQVRDERDAAGDDDRGREGDGLVEDSVFDDDAGPPAREALHGEADEADDISPEDEVDEPGEDEERAEDDGGLGPGVGGEPTEPGVGERGDEF